MIYEIESYESQLRTHDNLIDYTTVTIYISEVERLSPRKINRFGRKSALIFPTMPRISALSLLPYSFGWPAPAVSDYFAVAAVIVIVIVKACQKRRKSSPLTASLSL